MSELRHCRIEESDHYRFALDSRGRREYGRVTVSGAHWRHFSGGRWSSRAVELGNAVEAVKLDFLPARTLRRLREHRRECERPREPVPGWQWDAGRLLEDHRYLFDFLQNQGLAEWRCDFRAQHRRCWMINRRDEWHDSRFDHFSVSVRFRPDPDASRWFTVGEGAVADVSVNLTGLTRRIQELASSWRDRRPGDFSRPLPVILQAGDGAIFFHEILGHALEADHVAQAVSPFSTADLGKAIMPSGLSLLTRDARDPFFRDMPVDDEGESAETDQLVENGVLRSFIGDSYHADIFRIPGRGFARAENFSLAPLPRATALYVQPGRIPAEDLLANTRYGLLAREFGEGRAVLHRGSFLFHIADVRWIENGRLGAPAGPVLVSGSIRETLGEISMVGDDFRLDRGISYCRKSGQTLPVRVGQPSVKIERLQVSSDGNG